MHEIKSKIVGWGVATNERVEAEVEKIINASDAEILASVANPAQEIARIKKVIEQAVTKASLKRPIRLDNNWRLKPPYATHALYVQLNAIEYEGKRHPYEIFFDTKDIANEDELKGYPLLISLWFREAILNKTSLTPLIENLKSCSSIKGGYLSKVPEKPKFVNGLLAEIGYVIEAFSNECLQWNYSNSSHENPPTYQETLAVLQPIPSEETLQNYRQTAKVEHSCPECSSELTKVAGCDTCTNCGYNKCG